MFPALALTPNTMLKKDIIAQLDAMGISYNPKATKDELAVLVPTPKAPVFEQAPPSAVQINGSPFTVRPASQEDALRLIEIYREQNPRKFAMKKEALERKYGLTL